MKLIKQINTHLEKVSRGSRLYRTPEQAERGVSAQACWVARQTTAEVALLWVEHPSLGFQGVGMHSMLTGTRTTWLLSVWFELEAGAH